MKTDDSERIAVYTACKALEKACLKIKCTDCPLSGYTGSCGIRHSHYGAPYEWETNLLESDDFVQSD